MCALLPHLPAPWARWMQTRSHRTVFAESIKEELISPEEALSSAPCPGSSYSLRAGADLHPASQECRGMGVISPTKPHWLVWGMTSAGRCRALCWKGCMPVPPVLRLLAACKRRADDEGARAAAASPSVRPGEINKTLKLHVGGF